MKDETFEAITGLLVCTYGPIHVYKLMKVLDEKYITETSDYHLIALLDERGTVTNAIWHYDSRVDLPWIVYAIKRYLSIREQMLNAQWKRLEEMRQPERMAMIQAYFDKSIAEKKLSKEASRFLSAESMVERQQYRLDWLQNDYDNFAAALHTVEAMHPEGIRDVTSDAETEYEQHAQRIYEGRRKADAWRPYIGRGIHDRSPFLGRHVLQAGSFHIYQNLGTFERLNLHSGIEFQGGSNVPYMILFEDDALGTFDIDDLHYRYVPGPQQVCRRTRNWFAVLSKSITDATKELSATTNEDETQRLQESLMWRKKLYQRVYEEWIALDCPNAPDDNPDPVFDPTIDPTKGIGLGRFGRFPDDTDMAG